MSEGTALKNTPKDIVQRAYVTAGAGIVINRVGEKEGVPIIEVTLAPDVIAALKLLKAIYEAGNADRSHNVVHKIDDEAATAIFSDIMNRKIALDESAPI